MMMKVVSGSLKVHLPVKQLQAYSFFISSDQMHFQDSPLHRRLVIISPNVSRHGHRDTPDNHTSLN